MPHFRLRQRLRRRRRRKRRGRQLASFPRRWAQGDRGAGANEQYHSLPMRYEEGRALRWDGRGQRARRVTTPDHARPSARPGVGDDDAAGQRSYDELEPRNGAVPAGLNVALGGAPNCKDLVHDATSRCLSDLDAHFRRRCASGTAAGLAHYERRGTRPSGQGLPQRGRETGAEARTASGGSLATVRIFRKECVAQLPQGSSSRDAPSTSDAAMASD
mmetsp:Transcript_33727/g.93158  ORF Transcript_33727/g.93158 Transcript_33727/m.93158 type:complete len:217 (+) Transcript_33727:2396-3046(+)